MFPHRISFSYFSHCYCANYIHSAFSAISALEIRSNAKSAEHAEDLFEFYIIVSYAIREFKEEVGVEAGRIEQIAEFFMSPGFLTEKMCVFLAKDLTETGQRLEDDEILSIERLPLAEAVWMTRDCRFEDAKSIVGLLLSQDRLT